MAKMEKHDHDSPWKDVLHRYFREFMAFFFPEAHDDIDWGRGYEFLDKEFQKIVRDAELGRRLLDKLVKVWRKDGEEAWVLAHIEIQGQEEEEFAKRIYTYNYRIFDRYNFFAGRVQTDSGEAGLLSVFSFLDAYYMTQGAVCMRQHEEAIR